MLDRIKKYKNIVLVVVIITLAFFGYKYFLTDERTQQLLVSESSGEAASAVGAEIIALLNDLRSIRLDRSIFEDPVFQGLQDFSQPLTPEPVGRSNPFAPVGEE